MSQEEKIYIGIDVSKSDLDVFILPSRKYMRFKNNAEGIRKLLDKIKLISNTLIIIESTGLLWLMRLWRLGFVSLWLILAKLEILSKPWAG
ncbi:hypothetical protein BN59_00483 [Legionella massiliensis]|uniref:Uncharacterized protein n=1 Tax=Legionella massiliensis TaxID=1034943 RepID=A0A078KT23_9GAMM|nr:IS110 family transposase [Legionella massiliensis]CDZ76216.1 hypothetical protein BN59_00483 [Legionella massiliensis]CEE11954.1 hypothetical protein BN1094_00483 [Legionella massiliensis]